MTELLANDKVIDDLIEDFFIRTNSIIKQGSEKISVLHTNKTVYADADIDGVVSAIAMIVLGDLDPGTTDIEYVDTNTILEKEIVSGSYVVDVPFNNVLPEEMLEWLIKNYQNIIEWHDHHQTWGIFWNSLEKEDKQDLIGLRDLQVWASKHLKLAKAPSMGGQLIRQVKDKVIRNKEYAGLILLGEMKSNDDLYKKVMGRLSKLETIANKSDTLNYFGDQLITKMMRAWTIAGRSADKGEKTRILKKIATILSSLLRSEQSKKEELDQVNQDLDIAEKKYLDKFQSIQDSVFDLAKQQLEREDLLDKRFKNKIIYLNVPEEKALYFDEFEAINRAYKEGYELVITYTPVGGRTGKPSLKASLPSETLSGKKINWTDTQWETISLKQYFKNSIYLKYVVHPPVLYVDLRDDKDPQDFANKVFQEIKNIYEHKNGDILLRQLEQKRDDRTIREDNQLIANKEIYSGFKVAKLRPDKTLYEEKFSPKGEELEDNALDQLDNAFLPTVLDTQEKKLISDGTQQYDSDSFKLTGGQ